MQVGSQLKYFMKFHGIPLKWVAEIKSWDPPRKFEDVQLKGPFSKWQHLHQFEPMGQGTLMSDLVKYRLPLGVLGAATGGHFVKKDIKSNFQYRRESVSDLHF